MQEALHPSRGSFARVAFGIKMDHATVARAEFTAVQPHQVMARSPQRDAECVKHGKMVFSVYNEALSYS